MPFVKTWERECQQSLDRSRSRRERKRMTVRQHEWLANTVALIGVLTLFFFFALLGLDVLGL